MTENNHEKAAKWPSFNRTRSYRKHNCKYFIPYKSTVIEGTITIVTSSTVRIKDRIIKIVYDKMFHQLGVPIRKEDIRVTGIEGDWVYNLVKATEKFFHATTDL